MTSINRVFCETYQKKGVEVKASKGLALGGAKQKISVIKLEVLVHCQIFMGSQVLEIEAGQKLLVKEEDLHIGATGAQQLNMDGIEGPFIIIDPAYIYGIE